MGWHHHGNGGQQQRIAKAAALGFVAGVVSTVAAGGYFLYGPKGRQHRRKVERWVMRARMEILDRMEDLGDISKEQFHAIVDRVTRRYGSMRHIGRTRAREVADDLKSRYEEMNAEARRARSESDDIEFSDDSEDAER